MPAVLLADIQIRDPFVVPVIAERRYYLFGTTDKNCWTGPGTGFDCYSSGDLIHWQGPTPAFRPPPGFWASTNFWAPEVHEYRGQFYMLATFKAEGVCRGTELLISSTGKPVGPYVPLTDRPVTPPDWECLDGTLHVDEAGVPWMAFCHEWLQIGDGTICAVKLSQDLRYALGAPVLLFAASESPWAQGEKPGTKVTDGPYFYRTPSGKLLMLWSSFHQGQYAIGIATSDSGKINGPWHHRHPMLFTRDGGHGMLFRTFEGELILSIHGPNITPNERPMFVRIEQRGDELAPVKVLAGSISL